MTSLFFGIAAFLAISLIGVGLFGRPDQSKPTCSKCRRDAREFAWETQPTCVCGARLDRAGGVRTRGRNRRPFIAVLGVLLAGGVAFGGYQSEAIVARGDSLVEYLPASIVVYGIEHGWEWTPPVVMRRLKAPNSAAERGRYLLAVIHYTDAYPQQNGPFEKLHEKLLKEWLSNPVDIETVGPEALCLSVDVGTSPRAGTAIQLPLGQPVDFSVSIAAQQHPWCARVERILIGGKEVDFKLESLGYGPTRIAWADAASGALTLPPDLLLGDATMTVELLLFNSPGAPAANGDPIIDSRAPPSEWGVAASVGTVVRTFPVRIVEGEKK